MLSVHKLSPGRIEPSRSGDGLPIATNRVFVSASYAGVIHIEPAPGFQASANLAEAALSLVSARMRSVPTWSPGRVEPSRSGDGLPIATNRVFVSASYAGVIHIEPPPVFQASANLAESALSLAMSRFRSSPSHVVFDHLPHQPPCCGSGSEYQVQTGAPFAALNAFT